MAKQNSKTPKKVSAKKISTSTSSATKSIEKNTKIIAKKTIKPKKETEIDKNTFPIGKFQYDENEAKKLTEKYISEIKELPKLLKKVYKKINKENKNYTYRDGAWTIEQIIHHLADSHMSAFFRFKLTLTEGNPTIKPYSQNLFAETADVFASDIKSSIRIIKGVHERWTVLLKNMTENDFKNYYIHPEYKRDFSLQHALALYAWHGKHHVEQIKVALNRK